MNRSTPEFVSPVKAQIGHLSPASRSQQLIMAACAAFAISNCYALQPALAGIARSLAVDMESTGLLAGAMQIGYMAGILLLVPLGDRFSSSRVIQWQFLALASALFAAANSHTLAQLAVACGATALGASVAVSLSSLAFKTAPDAHKGQAVGTVAIGISTGILLSRFVGGAIADLIGWRWMFGVCGLGAVAIALVSLKLPQPEKVQTGEGYRRRPPRFE